MCVKEYYHSGWRYEKCGIEPFLRHVAEFLKGSRTVPVTAAPSVSYERLLFTLNIDLYNLFLNQFEKLKKTYECALKYGYRGYSKGGKNGVFLLRKEDAGLISTVESLAKQNSDQVIEDLDCHLSDLPLLRKVKTVYHDPSGERVVGVMNESNGRAIFLGFARY